MKLEHERVRHPVFGDGIITGTAPGSVEVTFAGAHGTKRFVCPDAFETWLTLCRSEARADMEQLLCRRREEAEAERIAREAEALSRREAEQQEQAKERRTVKKRINVQKK